MKGKGTKPERLVRSTLHSLGYRFLANAKGLPGHPDVAFTKRKLAVFIHGCFWHAHRDCRFATLPKTREEFWQAKLARNVERDAEKAAALESHGWRVHVVWECEVKADTWLPSLLRELGPVRSTPSARSSGTHRSADPS